MRLQNCHTDSFTGKMMNSDQATRRLVSSSFFLTQKRRRFRLKLGIFTDFQLSPPAFNFFQ
jgi:hypothetical protein